MTQWQFIHIPKNGGMSFRKAYAEYERELLPTHNPAFMLSPTRRTVAVMRHPLDRLVSIYAFYHQDFNGFRDWVDSGRWKKWPTLEIDTEQGRQKVPYSAHQTFWLREETYLIRFEDYARGVALWAEEAGFPQVEWHHRNASKSRNGERWEELLRDDQARMLYRYYEDDFVRRRQAVPLLA